MNDPIEKNTIPRSYRLFIIFLTLSFIASSAFAQEKHTLRPLQSVTAAGLPQSTLMNVNNVSMWMNANGVLERRLSDLSAGVNFPRGTSNVVYAGGLLWGGYVNDGSIPRLRVGGQTYTSGTVPGAIVSRGLAENQFDPSVRIYRVRRYWATADLKRDASEYFSVSLLDVTQSMVDAVREQYKTDWREWPAYKGAPYYERNGIPGYQAPSGDKYDATEDEPGLADADQVVWFVANDLDPTAVSSLYGSPEIGMEMQVTCWAFTGRGDLEQTVYQRYKLIYKGNASTPNGSTIDSMFVAKWVDPDIGAFTDDFVGSDRGRNMGFAYNAYPNDTEFEKYSLVPPAIGYALVQGPRVSYPGGKAQWNIQTINDYVNLPMTGFTYFSQDPRTTDYDLGSYNTTRRWWNIFRGYKASPLFPLRCFFDPITESCDPIELSGDPQTFRGSVDGRQDPAGDRRMAIISGPFSMTLGDTQEVVFAFVGATGSDHRDAIGVLKKQVDVVHDIFKFNFETPAPVPVPPLSIVELDERFIFDWESDTTQVKLIETYQSKGYKFEGYTIYQFPSLTANVSQAVLFPPFDITLPRSKYIETDLLRNNKPLVNGQEYYYAVTATMFNPDPSVAIPRIESPIIVKSARPHSPDPGVVYPYPFGTDISNSENIHDVYGANSAVVKTIYYDPTRPDNHTYKIRFHREFGSETRSTWDFVDISEYHAGTIVGGSDQPTASEVIAYTINGGDLWKTQSSGIGKQLNGITMVDVFNGYAVGNQGTILRTTDGGDHWDKQNSRVTVPLYSISMLDTNHGTAVGALGTVLKTTNGGRRWIKIETPAMEDYFGVALLDRYRGYIVGAGGRILHTINGGNNDSTGTTLRYGWYLDSTDTQQDLMSVAFPELNFGFAVGRNGTIERTTDGGFRWINQFSGTANDLFGLHFADVKTGVAVGANGTILRTTDGGTLWSSQYSGTTEHLYAVSFSDAMSGTAVGDNGTILRTQDGGVSWLLQTSGISANFRGVSMTNDNQLVRGADIDSPPQRIITRGMTVEVKSPYFGIKTVMETEANFQPTRNVVFNVLNPGENYMVVGKGYSNIDTIRGGSASDIDIELRFTGDSSWALFRGVNVPQSRWVRVPYQAWAVGKAGRDSIKKQLYTAISKHNGDSVWRPQVLLDRSYKGKTLQVFYPITIIADSFRSGTGYIGNIYDDRVAYDTTDIVIQRFRRALKGFVWILTQVQQEGNSVWEAYIADIDEDGIPAPLGTTMRFEKYHLVRDREEKLYKPSSVQKDNLDAARKEIENINVFPNPYYAFNRAEVNQFQRFVRFNHLPYRATIRIFNLAGIIVRTINKEGEGQFTDWDLNNERGLPAASGVYLAFLELEDKFGNNLGTKQLKLMLVQESRGSN